MSTAPDLPDLKRISNSGFQSLNVDHGVDDPFFILHMVLAILYFVIFVTICIVAKFRQKTVAGLMLFCFDRLILCLVAAAIRTGWFASNSFTTLLLIFEYLGLTVLVNIMADALYWDGNLKGERPRSPALRFVHQIFASLPTFLFLAGGLVGELLRTSQGKQVGDILVVVGCFVCVVVFGYLAVYAFTRTTSDKREGRLSTPEVALLKAVKGMLVFLSLRLVWGTVTAFQGRKEWWAEYAFLFAPREEGSVTEFLKYGMLNMLSEFVVVMVFVTTAWFLARWERVRRGEVKVAREVCFGAAMESLGRGSGEVGEVVRGERREGGSVAAAVRELSKKVELSKWEKQPMDCRLRRLVAVQKTTEAMNKYLETSTLGLITPKDREYKQVIVEAVIQVGVLAASGAVFASHEQMLRENTDPGFADFLHASLAEMALED